MKLLRDLFRKSNNRSSSELDQALDAVLAVEKKRDTAKRELDDSKEALQADYAEEISGSFGADTEAKTGAVLAAQTRLEAVGALLETAKQEAITVIAAGAGVRSERLSEVERSIKAVRHDIDRRMVVSIAEFANKHGFEVQWPSKANGGAIRLRALALGPEEIEAANTAVAKDRQIGPQEAALDKLLKERQLLNVVVGSTPDLALLSLLSERQRRLNQS